MREKLPNTPTYPTPLWCRQMGGVVYQQWPNQSFSIVNFAFSHYGHSGFGGGVQGGYPPPPMVYVFWCFPGCRTSTTWDDILQDHRATGESAFVTGRAAEHGLPQHTTPTTVKTPHTGGGGLRRHNGAR